MVPDDFGHGIVIPLLKNPDDNQFSTDNYRSITVSPAISKLFEMVLLNVFKQDLMSDPLQFGFKSDSSCRHALFTLKTVVDYHVKTGSTVNLCAIDISKAFDRVDHFALLQVLMDRNLPHNFIAILLEWYSKCTARVRWGSEFSHCFCIAAGVRQGGILSPSLFAVYIDILIQRLRQAGYGCKLHG